MGSGDTLANGSEVNLRGGCTRGKWELGDGVEGGRVFPSAVKFTLQVELDHFHIAQMYCSTFALVCAESRYVHRTKPLRGMG